MFITNIILMLLSLTMYVNASTKFCVKRSKTSKVTSTTLTTTTTRTITRTTTRTTTSTTTSTTTPTQTNICINGPINIETFPRPGIDGTGTQYTTGACINDFDCQTGCCGQNNKCRNPPAFISDAEFCQNGLTIDIPRQQLGGGTFLVLSDKAVASGICKKN